MWQLNLKSVLGKLSMLGIYLLFLSVQLNLKYTFSTASYATSCDSISDNASQDDKAGKIHATKEGKPAVQKLRLNKRYVPEEAFQISSALEGEVVIVFPEAPEQIVTQVYTILTPGLVTSFLRGPPLSTISVI